MNPSKYIKMIIKNIKKALVKNCQTCQLPIVCD